jgi:hypothetical protein
VPPQPAHALGYLGAHWGASALRCAAAGAEAAGQGEQQQGGERGRCPAEGERPGQGGGEQDAGEGAAEEVVGDDLAAQQAAVGALKVLAADDGGQQRLGGVVGHHLREAEHEGAGVQQGQRHRVQRDQQRQRGDERRAGGVHRDHHAAPVEAVGQCPGGEAEQQPGQAE